mgnify:CR=1 FL=1
MSIIKTAFKQGIWLAFFKATSQVVSWIITIIIAHILVPEDYGLMDMATVLTGYVGLFSELGLGAAIVQKEKVTDEELSNVFWFTVFVGLLLGTICITLAYPTVMIFNEKKILRVTQSVSLLYIISSILIVPLNILEREFRFKTIGFIDALSIVISCLMMVIIAKMGGGVWTLISGHIIRQLISCLLYTSPSPRDLSTSRMPSSA